MLTAGEHEGQQHDGTPPGTPPGSSEEESEDELEGFEGCQPIMRIAELPAARLLLHQSHRLTLPRQSMSSRTWTMMMRMVGLPAA